MQPAHTEIAARQAVTPPQPLPSRRHLSQAFRPASAPGRPRECLDCGNGLRADAPASAEFCCTDCRKSFNNRRAQRGAELYDLFMVIRFERGLARLRGVWTVMCALASAYRDSDNHLRAGRRSWRRIDAALGAIPSAFSRQGDRR